MQRGRRAFTLVELLVVISIIALLVGMLLPVLSRARQASMQVQCSSNLRQWAAAALMYAQQEKGWLPRRGQGVQVTTVIDRPSDWFNALPTIMRTKSFIDRVNEGAMPRPGNDSSVWMCPAALDTGSKYFFAYGMNMRLSTWNQPTPVRLSRIGSWATVVFLADAPGEHCSILPAAATPKPADYNPSPRHRGRLNVSFLDGHVASYSGAEVGCGVGDPQRPDVRWIIPLSTWTGPGQP